MQLVPVTACYTGLIVLNVILNTILNITPRYRWGIVSQSQAQQRRQVSSVRDLDGGHVTWHMNCGITLWKMEPLYPNPCSPVHRARKFSRKHKRKPKYTYTRIHICRVEKTVQYNEYKVFYLLFWAQHPHSATVQEES